MPLDAARSLGVLGIDDDERVVNFEEKPDHPMALPGKPESALCSMGIYVFNTDVLRQMLQEDAASSSNHDFGKDIIPKMLERYSVYCHSFVDENNSVDQYWRDVGTLDSYYDANMDLVSVAPQFNLYDNDWPLRTRSANQPPAKFVFADMGTRCGMALDSIICGGSILSGGLAQRCVLGSQIRINSFSEVYDSILFDGVNIGRKCHIRKAIIEKHVSIPDDTTIGYDLEADAKRFQVTENGVIVVDRSPQSTTSAPLEQTLS